MKLKINIRDCIEENADHNGILHVSTAIHVDDLLYGIPEEEEIDVRDLLAEQHAIALIWDTRQVRDHHPHLTEDQAWEVLQECERGYKSEEGLTLDDIAEVAHELFPEKPGSQWHARIDVRITDADGNGRGEVLARLRQMAELIAKDVPDVEADVADEALRLLESDPSTNR